MNEAIRNLEPAAVWKNFAALSAIPRCSRNEEQVRQFVLNRARELGLESARDATGNVVVRKPAAPDRETAPVVVLQGHLDMVCEKNRGVEHDFSRDGIQLVRDGDWLRARDTTLGADNGIAVAMMLALLESKEPLGALECLFTVDEETGLTGALGLDASLITGRTLINLDSEEEGYLCIGCAGGCNTYITLPVVRESVASAGSRAARLSITGLRGGHSGIEIVDQRANSLVLGARLLAAFREAYPAVLIADISGGGKHNAIPRELMVDLVWPGQEGPTVAELETFLGTWEQTFRAELGDREPNLTVSIESLPPPDRVLTPAVCDTVIQTLLATPNGVFGMHQTVPGLVETSSNLAAISLGPEGVKILTSQRSSRDSLITWAAAHVAAPARLAGGTIHIGEGYPSWPPNRDSRLLDHAQRVYQTLFGVEPVVHAVHAGLECGVIRDRVGPMDMVSIGPDIEGPHTPEERVNITSTERTWRYVLEILRTI